MTKNIKTQEELNKLLQQAKNNEISWDEKVKLELNIKINVSLGNFPSESWEKIKYKSPSWEWGEPSLIFQIWKSNKLFNKNWNFRNENMLEEFRKYAAKEKNQENNKKEEKNPTLEVKRNWGIEKVEIGEINENDIIISSWESIAEMLRDSGKIFNEDGDFKNEDALKFLQSIIDKELEFSQTVEYQAGEFELKEFKSVTIGQEWSEIQEEHNKIERLTRLKEEYEKDDNKKKELNDTKEELKSKKIKLEKLIIKSYLIENGIIGEDGGLIKGKDSQKNSIKGKKERLGEIIEAIKKLENEMANSRQGEQEGNNLSWLVPLERLFVIRGNMKEFYEKWEKEPENKHWYASSKEFYENIRKNRHRLQHWLSNKVSTGQIEWLKNMEIKSEVSNLVNPDKRVRFVTALSQWGARSSTAISGIIALVNQDKKLAVITAAVYIPFEMTVSSMKRYFDFKKGKWDEFCRDTEKLWDNFIELMGIIRSIEGGSESWKKEVKILDGKILVFVGRECDLNDNKKIDIAEIEGLRKQITDALSKEWDDSESRISNLVSRYKEKENLTSSETWWEKGKKILCCGKDKNEPSIKDQLSLDKEKSQEIIDNQEKTEEEHQIIDLDKHFEEEKDTEQKSQIEIPLK